MIETIAAIDPVLMVAAMSMILALLIVSYFLGGSLLGSRARFERRLEAVTGGAISYSGRSDRNAKSANTATRRRDIETKLKQATILREKSSGYKLQEKLIQAGLKLTPKRFYFFSILSGLILAGLVMIIVVPDPRSLAGLMMGLAGIIVGGIGVPNLILNALVKKRVGKFIASFPDAIDMIVRGVRTGLTVGESLLIVARESEPPLSIEFQALTDGIHMGMTLEDCLSRLVRNVPANEVRFFSIVLITQQVTGGNLAETLSKLSEILRGRKKMRDKIQAFSSEAKASAMIIGSLPFFVGIILSFVAPDYVSLLITTDTGNWLLLIGVVIMSIGIFVMRQMINFDI